MGDVLKKAQDICQKNGGRLTEKRQRVLSSLLDSETPLSAYEVADYLNKKTDQTIPAMSVYRMLDFLVSHQLVHKLSSTNKYMACTHIACEHSHQVPQFLICQKCQKVKEIGIPKMLVEQLRESVLKADYHLVNSQLELDCICSNCA